MAGLFLQNNVYLIKGILPKGITAGFTDRNISGRDIPRAVETIKAAGGIFFNECLYLNQVHGSDIVFVGRQTVVQEYLNASADGIVLEKPAVAGIIRTADCIPLFFAGRSSSLAGILHIGWKPAEQGIIDKLSEVLKTRGVEDFSDFVFILGPGLRKECFEVKSDFLKIEPFLPFVHLRPQKSAAQYSGHTEFSVEKGRLFFDLAGFIKVKLMQNNANPQNILDLGICSFCSNEKVFSFRKEKTEDRTVSFIIKKTAPPDNNNTA